MRILMLAEGNPETRDSWSGISLSILSELRRRGHAVLAGDCDLYDWNRSLTAVRTFTLPMDRWKNRFRLGPESYEARSRQAARIIRGAERPLDLILQAGATFEPRGRGDVPYVLYCDSNFRMAERGAATGHSQAVALPDEDRKGVIEREARVYAGASIIFTISDRLRKSFIEDFAMEPAQVVTIHAGANLGERDAEIVRDRGNSPIRGSGPVVLFVGRDFYRKGGDVLLAAFQRVRVEVPDARLVIIGPDRVPGRPPGVECRGFIDKDSPGGEEALAKAYADASLFCLPTRFEPFGVSYLEAMSYGLPCIGTAAWAVPEMVVHGKTGLTVPVDDEVAVAAAMLELIRDPDRARRMGEAGRNRVEQHFTWRAVVDRMEAAMQQLLPAATSGGT